MQFTICTSSLEKYYASPLPIFKLDYLGVLLLSCTSSLGMWILTTCQMYGLKTFSSIP